MSENEQLLDKARQYCDPATGEVLERIPDDLMVELRSAGLARGIPGRRSQRTESHATWFVFFSSDIQARVMAEWREANRARKRGGGKDASDKAAAEPSVNGSEPPQVPPSQRGLKKFLQRRKTDE